jgi:hypothetical protein
VGGRGKERWPVACREGAAADELERGGREAADVRATPANEVNFILHTKLLGVE